MSAETNFTYPSKLSDGLYDSTSSSASYGCGNAPLGEDLIAE